MLVPQGHAVLVMKKGDTDQNEDEDSQDVPLVEQFTGVGIKVCKTRRIYHHFVQGQGNPPECQRFVVHDKSWKMHVFDTRLDFPVPVQSGC